MGRGTTKRDALLDTAIRLFNRHGYRATGVDLLMAETGIAKTTLYRHFGSKEDLIVAALAKVDADARAEMRALVEASSEEPRRRILATFDVLAAWLADAEFKGCPFVAAAGEFGDGTSAAVLEQVRLHKRLMLAYYEELAHAARLPNPQEFARHLMMLHEGAYAFASVLGAAGVAETARAAASRLMANPAMATA